MLSCSPVPTDWASVIAFYKSVHVAEAIFYRDLTPPDQHSIDHKERLHKLKKHYPDLYHPFYYLFRASLVARYLQYSDHGSDFAFSCFDTFMGRQKVLDVLFAQDLVAFETGAAARLPGVPLKLWSPPAEKLELPRADAALARPPVARKPS